MVASTAYRFEIEVPPDRVVKLPDDIPVGHAEIFLVPPQSALIAADRAQVARELLSAAPEQQTNSADLLRDDRDRR